MCIGVCAYSFAIGSITSVLTTMDTREAKLKEKLNTLDELRTDYSVNYETYMKLKKALKYDHARNVADKYDLLKVLPPSLYLEMSIIMHQEMINKIPFFHDKDPHFIAYICPMLRPIKISNAEYIFSKGDPIDDSNCFFIFFNYISLFPC